MSLDALVIEKLAKWKPAEGQTSVEVKDPVHGWSAVLDAECVEKIGSRFNQVTLIPPAGSVNSDSQSLQTRAQTICDKATGLLEPLRLIEVDATKGEALIRSREPSQEGDHRSYYELLLEANGGSNMNRYQASNKVGSPRQAVPFNVTHDALGKLIRTLTS